MTTETPAKKKLFQVVVGYDLSELSERVIDEALDLVRHRLPAEIHVITVAYRAGDVFGLPSGESENTEEAARETVRRRVADVIENNQRRLGPIGVDRVAVYVATSTPAREAGRIITDLATAVDADLVVVGTNARRGIDRFVMGSVASAVVRNATTSVFVVQPADFVHGEKVPAIEPPLAPGEHHLVPFEHRRAYHYVDKVSAWTSRTMPVS